MPIETPTRRPGHPRRGWGRIIIAGAGGGYLTGREYPGHSFSYARLLKNVLPDLIKKIFHEFNFKTGHFLCFFGIQSVWNIPDLQFELQIR